MTNRPFKLLVVFSITVFFIITVTMALMGAFVMMLFRLNLIKPQKPELVILVLIPSSILVGTILSRVFGKQVISSIYEISKATKAVARGDFSIRLSENNRAQEINSIAHDFNIMTQELAKIEIFRGDFISNVSHEFKTPLSTIEGYATLLQSKSLPEDKREAYIAKILANTKRLSELTGNILQLSRLENQQITTNRKKFSLDEQLREVILTFEAEWEQKKLILDIDLDSVDFFGSPELLTLVWQNIIGNALKFCNEEGNVIVTLKKGPDDVRVTVIDNGIGMNEEAVNRVFEKFYQADTSHATRGNGLGMTLVKRIVDLHSGFISIASQEGKGTALMVTLPIV